MNEIKNNVEDVLLKNIKELHEEVVVNIENEEQNLPNEFNDLDAKYKNLFGDFLDFEIREQKVRIYYNGLATQSDSSILISSGEITLLCTLDIDDDNHVSDEWTDDFTPFSVHFLTKSYAFGRIPIGQSKREGKPSERDILLSRLIDRSIRPIIHPKFKKNSQLIVTLLSHSVAANKNQTVDLTVDTLALFGSAAAVVLSSMPIIGMPISTRIGIKNDELLFCMLSNELQKTTLDLFITFANDEIIMLECEANELPKEKLIDAIQFAREEKKKLEEVFLNLKKASKQKIDIEGNDFSVKLVIRRKFFKEIQNLLTVHDKKERNTAFRKLENKVVNEMMSNDSSLKKQKIIQDFMEVKKDLMKSKIFETGIRVDGRKSDEIRPISMILNVPFMKSSHGSSLFVRGDTRSLASVVLGTAYDEQIIDGFESDKKERFILHYNFLPYAVGEASQLKSPNRREVGHAKLAFKAIRNLIPEKQSFPYTIRVSSEILSCDGSSSMATICSSSLAMIDAGIPLASCVAGVAIGVVVRSREKNEIIVLTDIIGDEDHLGDMDFKIAGTKNGITALQMDVKDFGIKDLESLTRIIEDGFVGYNKILDQMNDSLANHTSVIKDSAPSIAQMMIEKSQIRSVIGNRGETIRSISEMSGARVDVDPATGIISIFGQKKSSVDKAREIIEDLILQPEVGKTYQGTIEKITDFGIFVKFLNDKVRGLIHEKNCDSDRYEFYSLKKSLKTGDSIKIKVLFVSSDGKIGLSLADEERERISNNSEGDSGSSSNNDAMNSSSGSVDKKSLAPENQESIIDEKESEIVEGDDILSILNQEVIVEKEAEKEAKVQSKSQEEKYQCIFF